MANLAPSWRPKALPNRGQIFEKSILKIDMFPASIFEGSRPRFGMVFGMVLPSKTHAKSKRANCVKT